MVGEMWGLRFLNAQLLEECGDFASVQLRGDWERPIVRWRRRRRIEDMFLPNHIHSSLIGTNLEQRAEKVYFHKNVNF